MSTDQQHTPTESEALSRADQHMGAARKSIGDAKDWLYGVGGDEARQVRYLLERLEGMLDSARDKTAEIPRRG